MVVAALGIAGPASAAPLNWEGTFTQIMADFPLGVMPGGGGVATVNDSAGVVPAHLSTLRLAASRQRMGGTMINLVTDPDSLAGNGIAAFNFYGIEVQTGTLGPISGGALSTTSLNRNVLPVKGMVRICLLSQDCTAYLDLNFTKPTTVNGVPGTGVEGVGIGGLLTVGGYGGVRMSLQVSPWTIKSATVITQITTTGGDRTFVPMVLKGWAHAPASTTSSTAQPNGMLQLVSPAQTVTNLPLGSNDKVAVGSIITLRFIPEPGLLLLLGTGVAGLAFLGRSRMRRK